MCKNFGVFLVGVYYWCVFGFYVIYLYKKMCFIKCLKCKNFVWYIIKEFKIIS